MAAMNQQRRQVLMRTQSERSERRTARCKGEGKSAQVYWGRSLRMSRSHRTSRDDGSVCVESAPPLRWRSAFWVAVPRAGVATNVAPPVEKRPGVAGAFWVEGWGGSGGEEEFALGLLGNNTHYRAFHPLAHHERRNLKSQLVLGPDALGVAQLRQR